ncbi:hypothetical protein Ancab_030185 [Ancistrocladus abbreviatus]
MKSSTRLDSAVFQLTPTRTRCDLVITANGKTEKIASGLLNPFLAHLKAAQEQIGKGGYSIILEPGHGGDIAWFTKGTVERFVRFVNTPEILERVHTIESEILQIEEAISFQSNNDTGLHNVEDQQVKSKEITEGSKHMLHTNEEKAIVLYKPHTTETDGSAMQEGSSKVQLLRVLETRKSVLQKEQGMAFARAVAAGFDIDHIAPLMSFAECFGASRMMEAIFKFIDLWKAKHESGQWLEIEAAEAMSCRSDISPLNVSGIVISSLSDEQKELKESCLQGEMTAEINGMPSTTASTDMRPQGDHQLPANPHEYPGHFSYPMFPPWPIHPQGTPFPVFQQYPMPMPYYQNYPANNPYFQPPYPSVDESRLHANQRMVQRRHSMDNRELSTESESQDVDASQRILHEGMDMEEEGSHMREERKKGSKSVRKQSGMVVIRNINYITSTKKSSSGSDSQSPSGSEADEEEMNMEVNALKTTKMNSLRSSNRKGDNLKSTDELRMFGKEDTMSGHVKDNGQWQAFQNFLLRDNDEDDNSSKRGMFVMEGKGQGRKRQSTVTEDPSVIGMQISDGNQNSRFSSHDITGDMARVLKPSNDETLNSTRGYDFGRDGSSVDAQMDIGFVEMGGRRGAYRRTTADSDDLMTHGREKLAYVPNSALHSLMGNGLDANNNQNRSSLHDMADESFIVPCRAGSLDQVGGDDRTTIDVHSEVTLLPGAEKRTDRTGIQYDYGASDLNLLPERVIENRLVGFDPTLDYEVQGRIVNTTKMDSNTEVAADAKQGPRKVGKEQRLKVERKDTLASRKAKPSKFSPSDDARARAERLRTFKADLQKLKKEKEEEQIKRLEALKMARQKRIAARCTANPAGSPLPLQQTRKQLAAKLSPSSHKGSKFSDTEPGPPSPLQRSTFGATSKVSTNSHDASKLGKLNSGIRSSGNNLSRSVPSLSELKEESSNVTPDPKTNMARIRRLSEPKSIRRHASSVTRSAESVSRRRISGRPETRKMATVVNLDKTKSATIPELKTRTSKRSPDVTHRISTTKEMPQKMNTIQHSNASSSSKLNGGSVNMSYHSDGDENNIVEKTVVMLELGNPSIPVTTASEEKISIQNMQNDGCHEGEKTNDSLAIQVQASPAVGKGIDLEHIECQPNVKYDVNEAGKTCKEKVVPDISSVGINESPYQAPYARVSSIEDPCMVKSEYGKAQPISSEVATTGIDSSRSRIPDSRYQKLHNISEALERPLGKESSKGFKKLLMFGKKNHSSLTVESATETDKVSIDGSVAGDNLTDTGFSGEVFTLRNLISQAETSGNCSTPQKSSRAFSLFSPFRSKSGEKKLSK